MASSVAHASTHVVAADLIALSRQAAALKLHWRLPVASARAGLHLSSVRGRGVDFVESRHYQPGDDIRHMDWRVTARSGRAHTKVFQEERERPVLVVLDLNRSMFFASRGVFKVVVAARFAALMGWLGVRSGDRIGAFGFGPRLRHEIRPVSGRRGVMQLIRSLVEWCQPPAAGLPLEPLSGVLRRVRNVARPGTMVFLVSDFYCLDDASERHLHRLQQHGAVVLCPLFDRLEAHAPAPGAYSVNDGAHAGILSTRNAAAAAAWQQAFLHHAQAVDGLARRLGLPMVPLHTETSVVEALRSGVRRMRVNCIADSFAAEAS